MFYSEAILSRRGPLGKVWLAAHWERKLSKTQTLQTDISESVDAILGQEIVPMALRLSGQLLLGVCRIYSRKAKYLLDDCNEALLKIKLAFRPGIVDMTEDQLQVPRNAITLSGDGIDIDLLMPDMNWDLDFVVTQVPGTTQNIARVGDITLANTGDITLAMDDTGYGFDLGPLDGIGSQDIDFDLGIDLDGDRTPRSRAGDGDETMSIEAPRDAPAPRSARESLASAFLGRGDEDLDHLSQRSRSKTRELTLEPEPGPGFDIGGMDIDMGGLDGGIDLGIGFDEPPTLGPEVAPATPAAPTAPEDTTQLEGEKTPLADRSRASTPLSEPPPTPGADELLPGITPKTAERISKKAEEAEKLSGRKKTTTKKLVVDSVAELAEERRGRRDEDLSAIQTEQQFLPNNVTVARLLEIRADPIAHFLPTKTTPNGTFFCAAPPGLPPALAEMFMFPTTNLRRARGATPAATPGARERDEEEELRTPKRARISAPGEDPEVEYGMRREPSERETSERPLGPDITMPMSEGFGGLGDDQPFDLGDVTLNVTMDRPPSLPKSRAQSLAAEDDVRSRYSTPGPGRTFEDVECPIAAFDHRAKGAESQTQTSESDVVGEGQIKSVSKNTAKALSLLQDRLQPDETGEEKVLSFAQVSTKATRRAASAFFFELLLLSTRDCVKVSQESEFANIEVRAKDRLWEQHVPAPGEVDPGREATPSVSSVIEGEMD